MKDQKGDIMPDPMSFRERCTNFSADVIKIVSILRRRAESKHLSDQLLRSGTAIGANVHEARGAESRADFIHKLAMALKEARETYYWLSVAQRSSLMPDEFGGRMLKECDELAAILAQSTMTARKNGQNLETTQSRQSRQS